MRIAGVVAAGLAAVIVLGGCGSDKPDGPVTQSKKKTKADIQRYADQTATIIESQLTNAKVTTTPCGEGRYSVQGVYRMPMWIRWQARKRATLRTTWQENKMPITMDSTPDGWLGAIGTVTPDGYSIDVASYNNPQPLAFSLQVRSPCIKAPAPRA